MNKIMAITGARERLRAYFKVKENQVFSMEELQIVSEISRYGSRIRELREDGSLAPSAHQSRPLFYLAVEVRLL